MLSRPRQSKVNRLSHGRAAKAWHPAHFGFGSRSRERDWNVVVPSSQPRRTRRAVVKPRRSVESLIVPPACGPLLAFSLLCHSSFGQGELLESVAVTALPMISTRPIWGRVVGANAKADFHNSACAGGEKRPGSHPRHEPIGHSARLLAGPAIQTAAKTISGTNSYLSPRGSGSFSREPSRPCRVSQFRDRPAGGARDPINVVGPARSVYGF
jgi:hypothetical protein